MASGGIRNYSTEILEEPAGPTANENHSVVYVTTSKKGLLGDNGVNETANGGTVDLMNFESRKKDKSSVPFSKKIDWASLRQQAKAWIKEPINMALAVWIIGVAISGAILFMVMTGMLNKALPKKSQRDTWFEVSNQVLNALFTLMCLYQHPQRFHHLFLLCRWRGEDMLKLQKLYCKNGTSKPDERKHMAVVIFLLHLNCFAQYGLCALNLGFRRSKRPAWGVGLTFTVAFLAPAIAALYSILSPLGLDYASEVDLESLAQASASPQLQPTTLEMQYSFSQDGRGPEPSPHWVGGLFDIWDDILLAYLSLFCSCCLFGWNMSRLGFGNMYVHIVTFLLFCLGPFFIFNLAAVNIDDEAAREALGLSGVVLCVFGLLYGGFWRIKMRQRFKLPGNDAILGNPDFADCLQWLCCCSCALSQEVRTANSYNIVENKFHPKEMTNPAIARAGSLFPHAKGQPLPPSSPFSGYYPDPDNHELSSHGSAMSHTMSGSSIYHPHPGNPVEEHPNSPLMLATAVLSSEVSEDSAGRERASAPLSRPHVQSMEYHT